MSTLHEHLPTDILPAELGGTGPSFNPGLWAEPVIHSAMKEAELAAIKKDKALTDKQGEIKERNNDRHNGEAIRTKATIEGESKSDRLEIPLDAMPKANGKSIGKIGKSIDDENNRNVDNRRGNLKKERHYAESETETILDNDSRVKIYRDEEDNMTRKRIESESDIECIDPHSETNSNEFEMIANHVDSEDSRDNSLDSLRLEKIKIKSSKDKLPEEAQLIT